MDMDQDMDGGAGAGAGNQLMGGYEQNAGNGVSDGYSFGNSGSGGFGFGPGAEEDEEDLVAQAEYKNGKLTGPFVFRGQADGQHNTAKWESTLPSPLIPIQTISQTNTTTDSTAPLPP
jgi:hypothetical protein